MRFTKKASEEAVAEISALLEHMLGMGAVLWLVSGGSAIALQVAIMHRLRRIAPDVLARLTVMPVDERYGAVGHDASNSAQMRQSGFEPGTAQWFDVLSPGVSFSETIAMYEDLVETASAQAKTVVATLGLGTDAHTAGILPASPAASDSTSTVIGYEWEDYTRMTLGFAPLQQLDCAWVLAYGDTKAEALKRLLKNTEPLTTLPSAVLYAIPDVTVYNDYIESEG